MYLNDATGNITADHSLIESPNGHNITDNDANNNIVGHDPMLGPLKNYGGTFETHVLLTGSPAIDTGVNPNSLTLDQRGTGFPRVVDGNIDLGAVENTYSSTFTTLTVTNTNDAGAGSLRQVIADAVTGDSIIFDNTAFPDATIGTISLTSGEIVIDKTLTITGDDKVTIDAGNNSRIFNINDNTAPFQQVTITGMVLKNGTSAAEGGAIRNREQLTLDTISITDSTAATSGGAIYNGDYVECSFSNILLSGNDATSNDGGAIYSGNYVTCSMNNIELTDNTAAASGGGMYCGSSGLIDITTISVSGNDAGTGDGGGIHSESTLNLADATVINNTAGHSGGGIFSHSLSVVNGTISDNTADYAGGGIHAATGDLALETITMTNNTATHYGGGIYFSVSTVVINNSTIAYNTAGSYGGAIHSASGIGTISNSTISNNSAGTGSAVYYYGKKYKGNSHGTISNSTIAANAGGHAIYVNGSTTYATCNLISTIVGDNVPDDATGNITADHSLIESPNGHSITDNDANNNIVGHDPMLGYLGNYGGDTQTHTLQDGSPAISSGDNPDTLATDQRGAGFPRVSGSIDIGAVEYSTNTELTITLAGTGTGTVVSNPGGINCGSTCTALYDPNATVMLSATPGQETVFSGWTGACSGTTNCTVTMEQSRSVTATFTANQYNITANATGNGSGSVTSDTGGINYTYPTISTGGSTPIDFGTSVTITATASTGSTVSWTGCETTSGTPTAATCTFSNLDSNETVNATFTLNQYTVTANSSGTGSGTIISNSGGISYTYPATSSGVTTSLNHGTSITLTANATLNSTASWTGCDVTGGTNTSATCTFSSLDTNTTVTAIFTLNQYTVTANASGSGSGTVVSDVGEISFSYPVTSSETTSLLNHGTSITLTAAAEPDSIVTWSGCDTTGGTSTIATCTFSNLDSNKTPSATFLQSDIVVTVTVEGNGKVTSSPGNIDCESACSDTYAYNTEITLTATPDDNNKFTGWTGDCSGNTDTCVITLTGTTHITASFNKSFAWNLFLPAIIGQLNNTIDEQ